MRIGLCLLKNRTNNQEPPPPKKKHHVQMDLLMISTRHLKDGMVAILYIFGSPHQKIERETLSPQILATHGDNLKLQKAGPVWATGRGHSRVMLSTTRVCQQAVSFPSEGWELPCHPRVKSHLTWGPQWSSASVSLAWAWVSLLSSQLALPRRNGLAKTEPDPPLGHSSPSQQRDGSGRFYTIEWIILVRICFRASYCVSTDLCLSSTQITLSF